MNGTLLLALPTVLVAASTGCQQPAAPLWPLVASDALKLQAQSQLSAACPGGLSGMVAFDRLVLNSNGSVATFTIPSDKVLVVTSFDWVATGSAQRANRSRTAALFRAVGGVNGPSAQSTALADSTGRAGASEMFPTGVNDQES
jgi:hypothetical protein